jgi:Zn-dependent M16 (insulinase) family peptidase
LIIAGKVSVPSLLGVLQDQVERSITGHHHSRPTQWKRPFVETVTAKRVPPSETCKETVEFPEKDESTGELLMSFVGSSPSDYLTALVTAFYHSVMPLLVAYNRITIVIKGPRSLGFIPYFFACCPVEQGIC